MQSQCPQCYSSEIVIAKPKSIFIWVVPMLVVDAAILVVAFSGMVENPAPLIVALVVADLLLTLPLMRAFLSRSQSSGDATFRCKECGHTWAEARETAEISSTGAEVEFRPDSSAASSDFQMTVENVFSIRNRGTVVTGVVESGSIAKGATIEIHNANGVTRAVVDAIEMFKKVKTQAVAGDNVGMLLRGVGKDDVRRGDVLRGIA
ncbi:MAG TPA: EF-Tu/IF-2/RF-3 family GTPase [Anaerolineae bacterium]|nr:EF-Tu/IF-2/RF-3 family GTPase [Anaerolineae bacterium]